jgi:hypothetical protein
VKFNAVDNPKHLTSTALLIKNIPGGGVSEVALALHHESNFVLEKH